MVGDGGDRRSCGEDPDLPREGSLSSLITHLLQSFLRISVKVSGLGWKASYPHKISKAELRNFKSQSTGLVRSLRFPTLLYFFRNFFFVFLCFEGNYCGEGTLCPPKANRVNNKTPRTYSRHCKRMHNVSLKQTCHLASKGSVM